MLDASKRPTLEEIISDPFMSDPIPKTIPRSTLACPPAKNFTDQYTKPSGSSSAAQQLSQKASSSNFERVSKKESEKEPFSKPAPKESINPKQPENFASSSNNFRASSKDIKQPSSKNLPFKAEQASGKKGKTFFI